MPITVLEYLWALILTGGPALIYLYLKTHNRTGLKYLGKTIKDPYIYKGSGTYWMEHLRRFGEDVTTEVLLETEDKEEIRIVGEFLSNLWDVVDSKKFANFIPETGDGGDTVSSLMWITNGEIDKYMKRCDPIPEGWSKGRSKMKVPKTKEHIENIRKALTGRTRGDAERQAMKAGWRRKLNGETKHKGRVYTELPT